VYAQKSSLPLPPQSPSSAAPNPQQDITKIKITSPTRGKQVPVGKDLIISGTSIDNTSTNNCEVSVRVNKVSPYQPATPATATTTGTADGGGTGSSAASHDYSKWNFVLTSKYTTIKPGQNRITAKYECVNNPALTSYSSVNVTGVQAASATTAPTTRAATTPISSSSTPLQTTRSPSTVAQDSNASNKPSSSLSVIAPQVSSLNQQQQQSQLLTITISNDTALQNYTFASTSPTASSGKLMYLGYHGITTGSTDTVSKEKTSAKSDNNDKKSSSSDTKSKSSGHNNDSSKSSSNKSSQSKDHKEHDSNGSNKGKKKSSPKWHNNHKGGDSFFGGDPFF
jgi:hypothetical protein